jgi:hypothetical protein
MIEAALGAELAANHKPGYNDAYDIAERGAQVTPALVEEAQDVLAATATLAAGATVLNPLLLPVPFLACSSSPASAVVTSPRCPDSADWLNRRTRVAGIPGAARIPFLRACRAGSVGAIDDRW